MASNLKYKGSTKTSRMTQIPTDIGASGLCRLYTGTQPASPDAALSGNTQLAELALSATAATATGNVLTFNAITSDSSADNTGTATWGSFLTSAGVRIVDFSVGTSGADLNLNTTAIVAGAQVSITSYTITSGN